MKKSMKISAIIIALGTFGVNLSIDNNGSLSLLSKVNANAPETTTNPPGWREMTVDCVSNGVKTGTAVMCMSGSAISCSPKECTTTPPIIN